MKGIFAKSTCLRTLSRTAQPLEAGPPAGSIAADSVEVETLAAAVEAEAMAAEEALTKHLQVAA